LSDKEILEQFHGPTGRYYAFNMLVHKYQQKIYWVIRRMVIDHDDANDVAQNVWIKALKGLENFREDSQLFTWLYRIAANESLTFLKNKKKKFLIPFHDVTKELQTKVDSGSYISGDDIQIRLQKAILELPEKQRLVFQMRYYDEMPYEQMSAILGTSVGALKASYHHAAKKIEAYFNKHN
jgi:RNA polymerase sigma-70 factor (ECF subfamily)